MAATPPAHFESPFRGEVKSAAALKEMPEEYRVAVGKIVVSHAINELVGAQVFDEPAIKLAPTPYDKWLACRIAMEEYGHHVRFSRVAAQMGIDQSEIAGRKPLNLFSFPLTTWAEFVMIKAIGDKAEVFQVEDLEEATYKPLRDLARRIMPEERFHAGFGRDRMKELIKEPGQREALQDALNRSFPAILPFFGSANSKNNELFRRWGVKKRSNTEMRAAWVRAVQEIADEFGLTMPEAPEPYRTELAGLTAAA